jgi:hypothetical protein
VKYLLTFSCYGTWLPADVRHAADRDSNGSGRTSSKSGRVRQQVLLSEPRYELNLAGRRVVLATIREVCETNNWMLVAVHVRTTHVHVIADVDGTAGRAITDFKEQSTQRLKESGIDRYRVHRWSRGGRTLPLRDGTAVEHAVRYVIECQGMRLSWYLNPEWRKVPTTVESGSS